MTRLLLALGLAASLAVPATGLGVLAAADSSNRPTEWHKDEIVDIHNELVRVSEQATPGSTGHAEEAQRIAREASAWADRFDAAPEWEEFAAATSEAASLLGAAIVDPDKVPVADYDRAFDRLEAAVAAMPAERRRQE